MIHNGAEIPYPMDTRGSTIDRLGCTEHDMNKVEVGSSTHVVYCRSIVAQDAYDGKFLAN
jgi:hypothetical protein